MSLECSICERDIRSGCNCHSKSDAERVVILKQALEKIRSYNMDIQAGRINYRPEDHILVIDSALESVK